ncbi:histidine phosphatase superfamily protein, clade-2, partial [Kipferlia bialata]
HGDRTPRTPLSSDVDPAPWPTGVRSQGVLTPIGMEQHLELGGKYRQWLVEDTDMLQPDYDFTQVSVRSTGTYRTVDSALSFMQGLYPSGPLPPTDDAEGAETETGMTGVMQPLPVHSVYKLTDPLLRPYDCCPLASSYMESLADTPAVKQSDIDNAALFDRMGSVLGLPGLSTMSINEAADPLMCDYLHYAGTEYALPPGVTEEDYQGMVAVYTMMVGLKYPQSSAPYETDIDASLVASLLGGNVLQYYIDAIETQLSMDGDDAVQPAFQLLSAHDSTLVGVLGSLDQYTAIQPPYASHLDLALSGDVVRMSLNGVAFSPFGLSCTDCPVDRWLEEAQKVIVSDWDSSCALPTDSYEWVVYTLSSLVLVLAGVAMGLAYASLRRKSKSKSVYRPLDSPS